MPRRSAAMGGQQQPASERASLLSAVTEANPLAVEPMEPEPEPEPDAAQDIATRGAHDRALLQDLQLAEHAEALEVGKPRFGHAPSFTAACMGEDQTRSPFRIGGDLTKTLMLGVICQRLQEELRFDRETERFVDNDRANALLDGPPPRSGWEQFYKMGG